MPVRVEVDHEKIPAAMYYPLKGLLAYFIAQGNEEIRYNSKYKKNKKVLCHNCQIYCTGQWRKKLQFQGLENQKKKNPCVYLNNELVEEVEETGCLKHWTVFAQH